MENRTLVFDMDGTIANLYGVENWLEDLRSENPHPYEVAEPMYPMDFLNGLLDYFKMLGWRIVVTTWLAKIVLKSMTNLSEMQNSLGLISMNSPMMKFILLSMVQQKQIVQGILAVFKFLLMIMKKSAMVGHLAKQ